MAKDDQLLALDDDGHTPERTCVLTRTQGERSRLVRLALSPDGVVAPDVRAKAPGRGAWIGVDRATLEKAIAKGKLRGALLRAFRTQTLTVPDDLAQRIEDALARDALDRLGLEARGGTLLTGGERIAEAARAGRVRLLLHARDAGDGRRKLDQAWRVGMDEEGSGRQGLVIPTERAILSLALGRENVVSVAIVDGRAAVRVENAVGRWRHYIGCDTDTRPCDAVAGAAGADRVFD
ncbi:DUF448 domain-containing protein [Sphingomonas quercus]|uniref:DUF448 domain-containing protein n=1 Tax=Sphingomonas quercus TaxID=2842451 RepID=A0ABS6BNC7_9SPHN|nr:DUF448 domain-containing protein [Sphingomonas quercus]MBU3079301.1 DUF448 domain-containing protein [Sphingomonas quercus]